MLINIKGEFVTMERRPLARSVVFVFLAFGLLSCNDPESKSEASKKGKANAPDTKAGSMLIKSRNDLDAFLVKGLSISEVVQSLGSPDSVMIYNGTGPGPNPGDDFFLWIYEDYPNESIGAKLTIVVRSKHGAFSVGDTVWDWVFSEP